MRDAPSNTIIVAVRASKDYQQTSFAARIKPLPEKVNHGIFPYCLIGLIVLIGLAGCGGFSQ
jgi:hypothetical protein